MGLNGLFVPKTGAAQLSAVWVDSGSNRWLKTSDDVLLYAPSDAWQNAQQLAAQLHTASDAIVLPGFGAGSDLSHPANTTTSSSLTMRASLFSGPSTPW